MVGHQIIKQPPAFANPYYAVFSSFTDTWILWNATREELMDYYAEKAAADARRHTAETIDLVDEDPRKAYYQFAMTFAEANAKSQCGRGEVLDGPVDEKLLEELRDPDI